MTAILDFRRASVALLLLPDEQWECWTVVMLVIHLHPAAAHRTEPPRPSALTSPVTSATKKRERKARRIRRRRRQHVMLYTELVIPLLLLLLLLWEYKSMPSTQLTLLRKGNEGQKNKNKLNVRV